MSYSSSIRESIPLRTVILSAGESFGIESLTKVRMESRRPAEITLSLTALPDRTVTSFTRVESKSAEKGPAPVSCAPIGL